MSNNETPVTLSMAQGSGETDFEAMTKAELVEYAAGLGIELQMTMTKAEMIEAIEGAE